MNASSAINAEAHQHHTWFVHTKADGIRGAIACVPAATLASLSETVGSGLYRVERVQPIRLNKKIVIDKLTNVFVLNNFHLTTKHVFSYRSVCVHY